MEKRSFKEFIEALQEFLDFIEQEEPDYESIQES